MKRTATEVANGEMSDDLSQVIKHGLFNDGIDKGSKKHLVEALSKHLAMGYKSTNPQFDPLEELQYMLDEYYFEEFPEWHVKDVEYGLKALTYFISNKMFDDFEKLELNLRRAGTINLNLIASYVSTGFTNTSLLLYKPRLIDSVPYKEVISGYGASFGANLTALNLDVTCFTTSAVRFLTDYLNNNSTLTSLTIESAITRNVSKYHEYLVNENLIATNIALMLSLNTNLKTLQLHGFQSNAGWPSILARSLKVNSTLQELVVAGDLDLEETNDGLSFEDLDKLSDSLSINNSLTSLNLSGYLPVGYDLAKMALALQKNTSLTSLYLIECLLDGMCIDNIIHILNTNTTLSALYLYRNTDLIEEDYDDRLKLALISSTSLTSLRVDNQMFLNEEDLYAQHFICNRSMRKLDLMYSEEDNILLLPLVRLRENNLSSLKYKFLSSVESGEYEFDVIEQQRLYYFERPLLKKLKDENDRAMLHKYNHFLSSALFMEILFCTHSIEWHGRLIDSQIIGMVTGYLVEFDVAKYQDYVRDNYQSIKESGFKGIL